MASSIPGDTAEITQYGDESYFIELSGQYIFRALRQCAITVRTARCIITQSPVHLERYRGALILEVTVRV